jgi:hypothetical protein
MKKLYSLILLTFLSILVFGQYSAKEQLSLADNHRKIQPAPESSNPIQAKAQNSGVDPTEFLSGNIAVKILRDSYHPDAKEYTSKESEETLIIGNITCQIFSFRLQQLIDNPKLRMDCSPDMHCGVVSGGSDLKARDPYDYSKILFNNRYPVYVRKIINEIDLKDIKGQSKLVTTYMSNLEDTTLLEGLTIEIKPYVAGEGQLPPLSPHYVIWLTGGKYLEHLSKHSIGSGSAMRWDDNIPGLVPVQGELNVGIPYVISEPYGSTDIYQTYDPLLISNYKEFEKFLLNPAGTFTIEASGNRLIKDDNFTSKESISLTINLSPYIELAPLEPLGLPEIAPLDPVGIAPLDPLNGSPEPTVKPEGEFELAPLEPIQK